jgi:hypothetical protein
MSRASRFLTDEELEYLKGRVDEGIALMEIAQELGRPFRDVLQDAWLIREHRRLHLRKEPKKGRTRKTSQRLWMKMTRPHPSQNRAISGSSGRPQASQNRILGTPILSTR